MRNGDLSMFGALRAPTTKTGIPACHCRLPFDGWKQIRPAEAGPFEQYGFA